MDNPTQPKSVTRSETSRIICHHNRCKRPRPPPVMRIVHPSFIRTIQNTLDGVERKVAAWDIIPLLFSADSRLYSYSECRMVFVLSLFRESETGSQDYRIVWLMLRLWPLRTDCPSNIIHCLAFSLSGPTARPRPLSMS